MTARSIRRAAERKTRKAAERAAAARVEEQNQAQDLASPDPAAGINGSNARLLANRANAQLSTGPRTSEGKSISSLNAVKTGLTGCTVLLPGDDVDAYSQHLESYEDEFQPAGIRERELVQSLADIQWRLQRIPGLEMAIYARGREQFAEQFKDLAPEVRGARMDLETFLQYERQIRNLHLQEGRLRRQREKDIVELRALQQEREKEESEALALAAKMYLTAKQEQTVFDPQEIGFEFSTADIEMYLESQNGLPSQQAAFQTAA